MTDNCAAMIDALIEVRRSKGITQQELARAAMLTQPVIARFECKKNIPRMDTLLRIADALGCEVALLPRGAK